MSGITQKLKHGNIFWKIPMKIPVNSLVTENVDSMCQTKTAGRGRGVYVLVVLRGVDPPDQTGGGSLRPGLWGIDAPGIG